MDDAAFPRREFSLDELAAAVGGRVAGNGSKKVTGVATLEEAGPGDLSFLSNPKYRQAAAGSKAGALIVSEADAEKVGLRDRIVAKDPYAAFASLLERFHPPAPLPVGIAPTAWIGLDVTLGEGVSIGPGAAVGDRAVLGDRVRILPGAVVGEGAEIGDDSVLHPNSVVYPGARLGRRVVLHAGVVIGADGYGYATVGGVHHKIPQVGRAIVEDDVEIGANSAVDRGALGDTVVGEGTKIDDLVMVAHGVRLGKGCLLVGQSGIAGSTRLGDRVTIAGQSGIVGHVTIGSGTVIAAKSAVTHDLPEKSFVTGYPAVPHREWLEQGATVRRLPKLVERVKELEGAVLELTRSLEALRRLLPEVPPAAKEAVPVAPTAALPPAPPARAPRRAVSPAAPKAKAAGPKSPRRKA